MKVLAYILAAWTSFEAALENLVGWHKATGSLPEIPAPPAVAPGAVTPAAAAAAAGPTLPSGIDTPDANGLVALTGLDPNSHYGKLRYAIAEVGQALPVDSTQRAFVLVNVYNNANAHWLLQQMIPVCYQITTGKDPISGAPTHGFDGTKGLPGTFAVPEAVGATVAAATAHFKALPEPTAGSGSGFVPGQPPAH
jgi:hypothetical protein